MAFISASINFFSAATSGLLVLLVTGPLGVPPEMFGLFIAVPAAVAIIGSLAAERVVPAVGGGPITWLAALVPAASFAVLGLTSNVPVILIAEFLAAVASSLSQIVVSTLRQAAVPDALLGRVTAAYRLIVLGVVPIGALAGGLAGGWARWSGVGHSRTVRRGRGRTDARRPRLRVPSHDEGASRRRSGGRAGGGPTRRRLNFLSHALHQCSASLALSAVTSTFSMRPVSSKLSREWVVHE